MTRQQVEALFARRENRPIITMSPVTTAVR
jgi:hypothetical protein